MGEYGHKFNMAVASELRAQRARVQITFEELAQRTGLAKNTVINYLNGKRDIPMPAFAELCRALDISQRVIFETAEIIAKQD